MRGGECADRLLDRRCVRSGLQPQRHVVDALVAGPAHIVLRLHDDGAMLARVVAPHAADEHRHTLAVRQRQLQTRSGRRAVEADHRFADVGCGLAERRARELAYQRQRLVGVGQAASDQRDRRPLRVDHDIRDALGVDARHAGHARCAADDGARQRHHIAGCGARAGARIEVGGQHYVEPPCDRIAKARDHRGQRDCQTQARDDTGHRDRRGVSLVARALDGEQRERMRGRCDGLQQQRHAGRHAGDSAEQQTRNRCVGKERHLGHRRQQRERDARDQQQRAEPRDAGM